MTFIIQNRNETPVRGINSSNPLKPHEKWQQYGEDYTSFSLAKNEASKMIKNGNFKADNIRILEVVTTFESELVVKDNSVDRYGATQAEPDYWKEN